MQNYSTLMHAPFPHGSSVLLNQSLVNLELRKPSFLIHQNDNPKAKTKNNRTFEQKDWDKMFLSEEMCERLSRIENNPFLKSNRVFPKYTDIEAAKYQISKIQKQKLAAPYQSFSNRNNQNGYNRTEINDLGIKSTNSNVQQYNDRPQNVNKSSTLLQSSIIKNLEITKDDKKNREKTSNYQYQDRRQLQKQSYYRPYSYQQTQKLPQENKLNKKQISYQQYHKPASFGQPKYEDKADVQTIIYNLNDSPSQQKLLNRQQKEQQLVTSQVEEVIINPNLNSMTQAQQYPIKNATSPNAQTYNRNNSVPDIIEVRKERYYLIQLV